MAKTLQGLKGKEAKNKTKVQQASKYESRLRVVTSPMFINDLQKETGWTEIKDLISARLVDGKSDNVVDFFEYPLPITLTSKEISDHLDKVFDSRNANFSTEYSSISFEDAATEFLAQIKPMKFIRKNTRHVLANAPCSIVVIDFDQDGNPLLYLLDISNVENIELESYNKIKSITFLHSKYTQNGTHYKLYATYDSERYLVERYDGTTYTTITDEEHSLGECPATFFIGKPLNKANPIQRWSPFGPMLGVMSEIVQFDCYKRVIKHYNPFPYIEHPTFSCSNEECEGGVIRKPVYKDGTQIDTTTEACTVCAGQSDFMGPGTTLEIEPADRKDEMDTRGMFRMIFPETTNLEWLTSEEERLLGVIKKSATGHDDVMPNNAVNSDQVSAVLDNKKKPLLDISILLSDLYQWIVETSIKLQFKADVKTFANFGTEFYLMTQNQLQKLFEEAKAAGMPEFEIDEIYKTLVHTKYRNDPQKLERALLLNTLNPAPYDNMEQAIVKRENNILTQEQLVIKGNFNRFINRFEADNGSIIFFGKERPYDIRVNNIYEQLKMYANEQNDNAEQIEAGNEGG